MCNKCDDENRQHHVRYGWLIVAVFGILAMSYAVDYYFPKEAKADEKENVLKVEVIKD